VVTYSDSRIVGADGDEGGLAAIAYPPPIAGGAWQDGSDRGYTDNAVAANGDFVFYSPEQLDGTNGFPGAVNVYEYRGGSVQFVATLDDSSYCLPSGQEKACSDGALGRLQVTSDGRYIAFVTTTNLTPYDSHGFAEMYRYDADTRQVICVSCRPDGLPPTADVRASQAGRFVADDGRTFFFTTDPLDPRDTDSGSDIFGNVQGGDVFEYVDGRARLITTGTGTSGAGGTLIRDSAPGLYGVSADGTDVYFTSLDPLVGQDRNGASALRVYDARTNGGFPFVPAPPPCQSADECHGAPSSSPPALAGGTGANLGSTGNYSAPARTKVKHHKPRRHKRAHHRAANHNRRAGR
jgi:hypothetical protein